MNKVHLRILVIFILFMSLVTVANSVNDTNTSLDSTRTTITSLDVNTTNNTTNSSSIIKATTSELVDETIQKVKDSIRIIKTQETETSITFSYVGVDVKLPVYRIIGNNIRYGVGEEITIATTYVDENTTIELYDGTKLITSSTYSEIEVEEKVNRIIPNSNVTNITTITTNTSNENETTPDTNNITNIKKPKSSIHIAKVSQQYFIEDEKEFIIDMNSLAQEIIGTQPKTIIAVSSKLVNTQGEIKELPQHRINSTLITQINESITPGSYTLVTSLYYENKSHVHSIPLLVKAVKLQNNTLRLFNETTNKPIAQLTSSNTIPVAVRETLLNFTSSKVIPESGIIKELIINTRNITELDGDYIGIDTNITNLTGVENTTFVQAYAIDPEQANITTIDITATAKGNKLYKCVAWNFTTQTCYGEWTFVQTIVPGEEYTVTIDKVDPAFGEQSTYIKTEWGLVSSVSDTWVQVDLTHTYNRPVILATPMYTSVGVPTVPRITNITQTSFELRLQDTGGGVATTRDVSYFVIEEGVWTLPDGTNVEAFTYTSTQTDSDSDWTPVQQTPTTTFTNPIVLGQVMSYNDSLWSVFWASDGTQAGDPTSANIYTGKHVGQDPSTTRNNEEIGVVIFEQDSGTLDGVEYQVYKTADSIQGTGNAPPYAVSHLGTFSSTPSIGIAATNGMDGANGGWPVFYNSMTTTQANMAYEEYDSGERSHTAEPAGVLIFESAGSYSGNTAPYYVDPTFNTSLIEPLEEVFFNVSVLDDEDNLSITYVQATVRYPNATTYDVNITQTTVGVPTQTGDIETGTQQFSAQLINRIGETGRIANVSSWQTVSLTKYYTNPVVFVFGQDKFSRSAIAEESTAIVTNITSSGFSVANIDAGDNFVEDDIGYVVLEEGTWIINGSVVDVGQWAYSGTSFVTRNFAQTFGSNPTVYIQIQNNSENWYAGRYTAGTLGTSSIDIQYEDAANAFSSSVTVGYIAFEQATSNDYFAGDIEAGVADDPGTGTFTTVNFPQAYAGPVFMGIVSEGGGDPTILGTNALTTTSVGVRPTEESYSDAEQNHATNDVLWMVFNESIGFENDTQITTGEDTTLGEITYEDIDATSLDYISSITVTATIDEYNSSASSVLANNLPALEILLQTSSGYESIGTISGLGNKSKTGSSQSITFDWASDPTYRDVKVRVVNMDHYNSTSYDNISWSNLYVSIQAGDRTVEWTYTFTDTGTVGFYNITQLETSDGILTNTTSYATLGFEVRDQTPPTITDIYNITVADDQVLLADFDATDYSGVASWSVNDSQFTINIDGLLENATNLSIGIYLLNISVNDTYDNVAWEVIEVNVTNTPDTTNPVFDPNLTSIIKGHAINWVYDVNATDDRGVISEYWINDTTLFVIDAETGELSTNGTLPLGQYSITVSVNDSSNNINTSQLNITIIDLTAPQFSISSPLVFEYGISIGQQLSISDNIAIDIISIDDSNFSVNNSGYLVNTTTIARGTYNISITANDTAGNENNTNFIVQIVDTTPPSTISNLYSPSQEYDWMYWNWSAPLESDLATYIIYLDGSFYTNTSTNFINITGLVDSTSYTVTVQTADADENINTTNVSQSNSTLTNFAPSITINAPANLSASLDTYRVLNTTITDENFNTMCVTITGSQSVIISDEHILYHTCSYTNNSILTYNWSRPVLENNSNAEVLWHFDNNSNYGEDDTTVHDFAGGVADHVLTCAGSTCPTYINNGAIGGAFDYDPTNSQAWYLTEQFFNDAFTTRSYQLWFKADDTSGIKYLFEEGGSTNGLGFRINAGQLEAAVRTSSTQFTLTSAFTDTADWHFLVVQYDAGNFSMFLDGSLVDTADTSASYTSVSAHTDEGYIGASTGGDAFGGATGNFDGQIDEFRITTTALTESEIINLSAFATNTTYYWNVLASDNYDSASSQQQFLVQAPTADMHLLNITVTQGVEGVNSTIYAYVNNTGTTTENNILVEFIINNTVSINRTISSSDPGEISVVNISYLLPLGSTVVNATVDADSQIIEVDETNNNFSTTVMISSWHTYYGILDLEIILGNTNSDSIYTWFESNATGIIYAIDSDANINFANLYGLGRNTSNETSTNDFSEADSALGMTGRFDSITTYFASDSSTPRFTRSYTVAERTITNVPATNSTNTNNFQTGILWDATSDTTGEYDENETLIFIANVADQLSGLYGTYDFELIVPTNLENTQGVNPTLDIYIELE